MGHYNSGSFGKGWLCSSGVVRASSDNSVEIVFDSFWVGEDGGDSNVPRANPTASTLQGADRLINSTGRTFFLSQFAVFPVLFFDKEAGICVFQFPPLKSNIAAKLVRAV